MSAARRISVGKNLLTTAVRVKDHSLAVNILIESLDAQTDTDRTGAAAVEQQQTWYKDIRSRSYRIGKRRSYGNRVEIYSEHERRIHTR